jgi:hypothetical protein
MRGSATDPGRVRPLPTAPKALPAPKHDTTRRHVTAEHSSAPRTPDTRTELLIPEPDATTLLACRTAAVTRKMPAGQSGFWGRRSVPLHKAVRDGRR